MIERFKGIEKSLVAAVVISVMNVVLIWSFRFLPLYDYPIWLFEVHILRNFWIPEISLSEYFEIVAAPVPNLGFVLPAWLLSWIVSLEVAGKLILTLCVIGLPWSFWFVARSISNNMDASNAYLVFPYAFNLFFFGGHAYLIGLIVLNLAIAYFWPRLDNMTNRAWLMFSVVVLLSYLAHGIVFGITVISFLCFFLFKSREKWKTGKKFFIALVPSLAALVWYWVTRANDASVEPHWSLWNLGRNFLKAVFLFIKSYGIDNPLPLSILNLAWLIIVIFVLGRLLILSFKQHALDRRLIPPIVLMVLMILGLPDLLLGVYQPGPRFALPLLFFVVLLTIHTRLSVKWKWIFIGVALVVTVYNGYHFQRVNRLMTSMYNDVKSTVDFNQPLYVVGLDWPAHSGIWDIASASVNPLFGIPYYLHIENGGTNWIHETAILRMKHEYRFYKVGYRGRTVEEFEGTVIEGVEKLKPFKYVIINGRSSATRRIIRTLSVEGFRPRLRAPLWTILERE